MWSALGWEQSHLDRERGALAQPYKRTTPVTKPVLFIKPSEYPVCRYLPTAAAICWTVAGAHKFRQFCRHRAVDLNL
jgi:hypothetical protein